MEGLTSPAKEVSPGSEFTIHRSAWKVNSTNFAMTVSQKFDREDLSNVRAFERITSTASSRESPPMSVSHTKASMPIVAPIP